jgi:hypothetical protein
MNTLRLRMIRKPMTIMMIETQTPYIIFITLVEADVPGIERWRVKFSALKSCK